MKAFDSNSLRKRRKKESKQERPAALGAYSLSAACDAGSGCFEFTDEQLFIQRGNEHQLQQKFAFTELLLKKMHRKLGFSFKWNLTLATRREGGKRSVLWWVTSDLTLERSFINNYWNLRIKLQSLSSRVRVGGLPDQNEGVGRGGPLLWTTALNPPSEVILFPSNHISGVRFKAALFATTVYYHGDPRGFIHPVPHLASPGLLVHFLVGVSRTLHRLKFLQSLRIST